MISRKAVVAEAREWLGTRYQHQARIKGAGVDCAGLLIGVMRELGCVGMYGEVDGYARQPDARTFNNGCAKYMTPIAQNVAGPGDVAAIAFRNHPMHLAIIADYAHGGLSIIHALMRPRKVVEHRLDDAWLERIVGWHRINGVYP